MDEQPRKLTADEYTELGLPPDWNKRHPTHQCPTCGTKQDADCATTINIGEPEDGLYCTCCFARWIVANLPRLVPIDKPTPDNSEHGSARWDEAKGCFVDILDDQQSCGADTCEG